MYPAALFFVYPCIKDLVLKDSLICWQPWIIILRTRSSSIAYKIVLPSLCQWTKPTMRKMWRWWETEDSDIFSLLATSLIHATEEPIRNKIFIREGSARVLNNCVRFSNSCPCSLLGQDWFMGNPSFPSRLFKISKILHEQGPDCIKYGNDHHTHIGKYR